MIYLLAHNQKNLVKKGDKVEKYKTPVATVGKGWRNEYSAHLHISRSTGLTESDLKSYVNGWSKERVEKHYSEPQCDFNKMFGRKMDVGNLGYDWLQWYGKGFHPGLDINSPQGGDSDLGIEFTSPCTGEVIFSGNWGKGWGRVILIQESIEEAGCEMIKANLEHKTAENVMLKTKIKEQEQEIRRLNEKEDGKELPKEEKTTTRKALETWAIGGVEMGMVYAALHSLNIPDEVNYLLVPILAGGLTALSKYLYNLTKQK